MNKVIEQNAGVSASVIRTNDTDERWIVTVQGFNEPLCPISGCKTVEIKEIPPINTSQKREISVHGGFH
jgi:hypothetical protein